MQLLADLYIFLIDEIPQIMRRELIECMTFYARDTLENMNTYVQNDPGIRNYLQTALTST